MKCTSINLVNRNDYKKTTKKDNQENTVFYRFTNDTHSYSFTFKRNQSKELKKEANLSVMNLIFPDTFPSFNAGYSLDRWSKKRPRLKSSKRDNSKDLSITDEYDISFDVNDLLNDLDEEYKKNNTEIEDDNSTSYLEYELHSDIQELIEKSQRQHEEETQEVIKEKKKRKKSESKGKVDSGEKSKKKVKNKSKKTIKFSLSKPPSPQTEQIIRVDVTSNMSVEEIERNKNNLTPADCSKGHIKLINDRKKHEERNLNQGGIVRYDDGSTEEEFIIRCRQLAISKNKKK